MMNSRGVEDVAFETLVVACPSCGKKIAWSTCNKYRPFCSERCKLTDLGAWAAERYRLAGEAREEDASSPGTGD